MKNIFQKIDHINLLTWIALLRIMLGLMFLSTWYSNRLKGFYTPDGLLEFFTHVFPQSENPLAWYAAFIQGFILPIRHIFAPFQLIAEFVMGLALLVGGLTVVLRLGNVSYYEAMIFSILLASLFAPLIDYVVVELNVRRRKLRWREAGDA